MLPEDILYTQLIGPSLPKQDGSTMRYPDNAKSIENTEIPWGTITLIFVLIAICVGAFFLVRKKLKEG